MLWMGKELKEYNKEELILIVEILARTMKQQVEQHNRDLDNLFPAKEN